MRLVALQPGIRDPADIFVGLEPLCEFQRVIGVALGAQREGLGAEEELLGCEGVEGGAEVALDFDARADRKGDGAKGFPEFEAVVAGGGLHHGGEAGGVLAPVEFAAVNDDTADGGAVAYGGLVSGRWWEREGIVPPIHLVAE